MKLYCLFILIIFFGYLDEKVISKYLLVELDQGIQAGKIFTNLNDSVLQLKASSSLENMVFLSICHNGCFRPFRDRVGWYWLWRKTMRRHLWVYTAIMEQYRTEKWLVQRRRQMPWSNGTMWYEYLFMLLFSDIWSYILL